MPERNPLIDVDLDHLDQEWASHMGLAMQLIEEQATADRELVETEAAAELAKDQLKAVKAELYLQMRGTPSEFGLPEKPSETTLESAVIIHSLYRAAQQECRDINSSIIKLQEIAALCKGRVYVCRDKKEALQDLVKLHLTGFHSEPRVDTEVARNHTAEFQKDSARKPITKPKARR